MSGAYVILALVVAAVRIYFMIQRSSEGRVEAERLAARPPPDDPRWGPRSDVEQVVGKVCARCSESFVIAGEAKRCKTCDALVHKKGCFAEHKMAEHRGKAAPYR